jgi:uridine kinase
MCSNKISSHPIIIGIAGPSASGKTLLANTISNEIGTQHVAVIPEDSYYKDHDSLSLEERSKINYDHPDAMDHELLYYHLNQLKNGEPIDIPIYDHGNHQRALETKHIANSDIVILEGILLFVEQKLRQLMDIKIFMDTPLDLCLTRRIKRDITERNRSMESVLAQYENTVRPMYLQFIEPCKKHADIMVPKGGTNRKAIDMIKSRIKDYIKNMRKEA